jgi:hypothetical protein
LVSVPVADVDRAKAFYVDQVGFCVEQDVQVDENHRFVELMPRCSPCSIALTTGYIDSQPGCLTHLDHASRTGADATQTLAEYGTFSGDRWTQESTPRRRTTRTQPASVFALVLVLNEPARDGIIPPIRQRTEPVAARSAVLSATPIQYAP